MLKMTKIKLELFSDIVMYLFIEKGMRWGVSYITRRFNEANNKCNYKSYGWTMSQYLPYVEFKWLN